MFNDNCRRIENSSGAKIGSEMKTPPHTIVSLALAAALCGLPGLLVADSGPVELRGKWVLDPAGKAIGPDSFRRGLQPSALLWRGSSLLSAGDQRSQFPGHLFSIDPKTGRLLSAPLKITPPVKKPGENSHFKTYRSIPNSDFEGLAALPDGLRLYGVTEDKIPWLSVLRLEDGAVKLENLVEIRFPEKLRPWQNDSNFRLEGIALADTPGKAYLAFERAADELPRILELPLKGIETSPSVVAARDLGISFSKVTRRKDKKNSLLNINDIQFLRRDKRAWLVALARDQERILLIDLEEARVVRWIDLDLRGPAGERIHWVSPEGLAIDPGGERLWIINDPDSVKGNYRRRGEKKAGGPYALYTPLLFELRLSELFPGDNGKQP